MILLQQPQEINYSQSIPDFEFSTEDNSIRLRLDLNGQTVVDEEYDAPPSGIKMKIKISDLIENFMEYSIPVYSQDITVHENGIKDFYFILEDTGSAFMADFRVIKGFLRKQPFDLPSYLRDYWLNIVPKYSEVYFHQPLYLTALPPEPVNVTIKALMADGAEKTIQIGQMESNKLQSVNLNPGRMIYLLGGKYTYFEAFTVGSNGEMKNGLKRFYFKDHYEFHSDVFFYQNRLGGWDTLVLNGHKVNMHSNTPTTAVFEEMEFEYQNDLKFEIQKSSGFITTEEDYKQYIDFLISKNKYFLHEGSLIQIVTSEHKVEQSKGNLNSYSFVFRPSNTRLVHPGIGAVNTHLIIT